MNKGIGQYDLEYSACPCFWGTEPGKFVKYIPELTIPGDVLDIGAGEGKNSIYLAELGFNVTAVEVSNVGLANFETQLRRLENKPKGIIKILKEDIIKFNTDDEFDVVIAYGLLHCLESIEDVHKVIAKIKQWTKIGGLIVVVSFNDELPVPTVQAYLEPTLLPSRYLHNAFAEFDIIKYEEGVITETHPTSKIEHQHSLTRIIAKKR